MDNKSGLAHVALALLFGMPRVAPNYNLCNSIAKIGVCSQLPSKGINVRKNLTFDNYRIFGNWVLVRIVQEDELNA